MLTRLSVPRQMTTRWNNDMWKKKVRSNSATSNHFQCMYFCINFSEHSFGFWFWASVSSATDTNNITSKLVHLQWTENYEHPLDTSSGQLHFTSVIIGIIKSDKYQKHTEHWHIIMYLFVITYVVAEWNKAGLELLWLQLLVPWLVEVEERLAEVFHLLIADALRVTRQHLARTYHQSTNPHHFRLM